MDGIAMKRTLLCILALSFAWGAPTATAGGKVKGAEALIRLKDSSQVVGRIDALRDGVYHIKTKSLGVVKVPVAQIESIVFNPKPGELRAAAAAAAKPASPPGAAGGLLDVQWIVQALLSNEQVLGKVEKLAADPQIQAVLDDPEIMKAIEAHDFLSLFTNEKIRALTENPTIKEIGKGIPGAKDAK